MSASQNFTETLSLHQPKHNTPPPHPKSPPPPTQNFNIAPAKLVFGGGSLSSRFATPEQIQMFLSILKQHGVHKIDTAFNYGDSESCLGDAHACDDFAVDTKHPGGFYKWAGPERADPTVSNEDGVVRLAGESLGRLRTKQVDIYYIHAPECRIPFESTLAGINTLHKANAFRRFGLSNFLPAEVEEVIRICKERNYILPTVYQGSYSAIQRLMEAELLPVLRKHKMSYYGYSPSGGRVSGQDA